MLPHDHPVEIPSEDDRRWFWERPGETSRVRDLVPGEFGRAIPAGLRGLCDAVPVTQIRPGLRIRRPIRYMLIAAGSEVVQ